MPLPAVRGVAGDGPRHAFVPAASAEHGVGEHARARKDLADAKRSRTEARTQATAAAADVERARRRHWGWRDHDAIEHATHQARRLSRLSSGIEWERDARRAVDRETAAQRARMTTLTKRRPVLDDLERSVQDLDHAVAGRARGTRGRNGPANSRAGPSGGPGPPAGSTAARQVWCAIAWEVETWRDDHPHQVLSDRSTGAESALGLRPEWYADRLAWDSLAVAT